MENTEAIWQQRLAKRREGIPWKTIVETEGFKYGGTFTSHLKKARERGWIPPEDQLPPARRSDGRRQGLMAPKQEDTMSTGTVAVDDAPPVSAVADIPAVSGELVKPLSVAEVQTLAHYEQIIAQGIKTFVEVGRALTAIRDQHLYRESYGTFEDYLRERWDLSRPYAYQLMEASAVVENVSATADIVPVNEAQARPLATLPPEQQAEVWQEAVRTAPPSGITAKHVQTTVKKVRERSSGSKVSQPKTPVPSPRQPPRMVVQNGLFAVLSMVKDVEAWAVLKALAHQLASCAEQQVDPDLMQHMEQALSPLFHLIEDHQAATQHTTDV
jgi:hypothetical protein